MKTIGYKKVATVLFVVGLLILLSVLVFNTSCEVSSASETMNVKVCGNETTYIFK